MSSLVRYTANTCRQNEHVSRTKEHRSNGRGAPLYSSFCTRTCLSMIPSILSCYIDSFFLYSLFLYRNKQKANFHKRKKIAGTTSITRATSTVVKGRIQILPTAWSNKRLDGRPNKVTGTVQQLYRNSVRAVVCLKWNERDTDDKTNTAAAARTLVVTVDPLILLPLLVVVIVQSYL